jgi:Interferon-induced transmembrane protein
MSDSGSTPPPPPPPMPAYGASATEEIAPPSHLGWAIVSIVLFWPFAVPAIIFAAQVSSKWAVGDVAGAQASSEKAKNFAIWATIAFVIELVAFAVVALVLHSGIH